MKAKQYATKQQWITEETKEEIKKILGEKEYLKTNENENSDSNSMGSSKSSSKRDVYSNRILPQETRKISNKHYTERTQEKKKQNPKLVERKKS